MLFCGPVTSHLGTGIPVMILGSISSNIRASQEARYLYSPYYSCNNLKGYHKKCTASREIKKKKNRGALKKNYETLDMWQSSLTPPPREVWTQKVWTLRMGSDTPSPYRSLDIWTKKDCK